MSELFVVATDLLGNIKAEYANFNTATVTIPNSDMRTAEVTFDVYDNYVTTDILTPMNTMLKVWYNSDLVFHGKITQPIWTASEENVVVSASDPGCDYQTTFLSYQHYCVNYGYPCDGRGFFYLAEAGMPNQTQLARGIPHPGVYWGTDTTTHQGPRGPDINNPVSPYGIWKKAVRGDCLWTDLQNLATMTSPGIAGDSEAPAIPGLEFMLIPVDVATGRTDNGGSHSVDPGYYAQMNVSEQFGIDRRPGNGVNPALALHCNWGVSNVDDFVYQPDGSSMINTAVVTVPGGPTDLAGYNLTAKVHLEASWDIYGIKDTWQTGATDDNKEALLGIARYYVEAYGYPPEFYALTLRRDDTSTHLSGQGTKVYHYGRDYNVGDIIRATVKMGGYTKTVDGRIDIVTLNQVGSGGASGSNSTDTTQNTKDVQVALGVIPLSQDGDVVGGSEVQ
jgi:hypothetical protein